MGAQPGWYPDSRDPGVQWYWNGVAYTARHPMGDGSDPRFGAPASSLPQQPAVGLPPAEAAQSSPATSADLITRGGLVKAVCTQCGGQLEVDPAREAAVCPFCRTPYIVATAIHNFAIQQATVEHADIVVQQAESVHIRQGAVASVVGFVERQVSRQQQQKDDERRKQDEEAQRVRDKQRARDEELRRLRTSQPFLWFVRRFWVALTIAAGLLVLLMRILGSSLALEENARPDATGNLTMPQSSLQFQGEDYRSVISQLHDRGFTNVVAEPLDDLVLGWVDKPDEVDRVTVDADPDFTTSERFAPDVKIIVYYHSFPPELVEPTTPIPDQSGDPGASGYTGPRYEIVIVETVGIGLPQIWVMTDGLDLSDDAARDHVKSIIADVARQQGSDEIIVQVVTDVEVAFANADTTIADFMDEHGIDYYRTVVAPKERTQWIAWYTGGFDWETSERSTADSAFTIDWMPAGELETVSWRP